jgi:hypothetical protein
MLRGWRFAAPGEYGAAIGSAYGDSGNSSVGQIVIEDGRFEAAGGQNAAGIGSGHSWYRNSWVSSLTIRGGSFWVVGGTGGPGIGPGASDIGESSVRSIEISGGQFDVTAGRNSAAIGTAETGQGSSVIENLTITGGTFALVAGIGTGMASSFSNGANSTIGRLSLSGGVYNIWASPNCAGIGSGAATGASRVDHLIIQKVKVNITSGQVAAIGGRSVQISNSTISINGRSGPQAILLDVNNLELTCIFNRLPAFRPKNWCSVGAS